MRRAALVAAGLVACSASPSIGQRTTALDFPVAQYLAWTSKEAQEIGRAARAAGRVGGGQGLLHTERAYSYKLRATWLDRKSVV